MDLPYYQYFELNSLIYRGLSELCPVSLKQRTAYFEKIEFADSKPRLFLGPLLHNLPATFYTSVFSHVLR